jgi:hypothetical protein
MKSIWLGIMLTAATLVCAASPAVAHEFTISPAGSGFIGKGGTQTILLGSHAISCKLAKISGRATHALLLMGVGYETCEIFSKSAQVSEADYFDNANGLGGIAAESHKTTITVKPTAESECVYTLPETTTLVNSVSYTTKGTGITIKSALKGLAYELKETGTAVCGTNGEKSTNGEYKGEVTTETYVGTKCVFWGPGGFQKVFCIEEGPGWWELVIGYTSLAWS